MAMTLKFSHLVDLFERLDRCKHARVITTNRNTNPEYAVVREWFRLHDRHIPRYGPVAVAFLSCLFPERLTQRTYNIREQSLSHIIPRILAWGATRAKTVRGWKDAGADFAVLVETEMARTENASPKSPRAVTVEQADAALFQLAANSHYSAPAIRGAKDGREIEDVLTPIFSRLKAREAKWFVRLVLKDLRVVQVPEKVALECFHFLLPDLLSVVSDFDGAVDFLSQETIKQWPISPSPAEAKRLKDEATKIFQPKPGAMIPRTAYDKARSLKHAMNLARSRTMSVERKYDGEYCQIHIQRGHDKDTIQIFSKSGRDSTMDRQSLHRAITSGLDLAGQSCRIKFRCVLEGELVVWSRCQQIIQPFYKIRNHVRHGGRRLGRANDGPKDPQEQLMIVFYDLLLFDDEVKLTTPHHARRQHLKSLVKTIPGVSMLVERQLVDCDHQGRPRACTERLRQIFALAITNKWEGLVLKGRDDPYLSFVNNPRGIKLKKDYLAQLGDVVDLCIIGARLDPRIVGGQGQLKWNKFYLACLVNKEACQRFGELPSFNIIDSFCDTTGAIPKQDLEHLNATGIFCEVAYRTDIEEYKSRMLMKGDPPAQLFRKPFVVECFGAGFDKNSDCAFWTLRFPRLARIHHDRSFLDTMDFAAMQEIAELAQISPPETDDVEVQRWIERLVQAEGKSEQARDRLASPSTGSVPRTPHSATTASLSPVAARNRPPSLPLVWKQVQTRSMPAFRVRVREETQQTTTTSTRTPSTARTWTSPNSLPSAALPAAPESAPTIARHAPNSWGPRSPITARSATGIRRRSDSIAAHLIIKRPRLVGGRTILETPTPPREEIDLTHSSPCGTPTRLSRPSKEPVAHTPSGKLSPRSGDPNGRTGPLSLSLPPEKFAANSRRRRTSSTTSTEAHEAESHLRRRARISASFDRRPLAEMSIGSPCQRAPPASLQGGSNRLEPVRETSVEGATDAIVQPEHDPKLPLGASERIDSASTLPTPPSTEEAARREEASLRAVVTKAEATPAASAVAVPATPSGGTVKKHKTSIATSTPETRKTRSAIRSSGPMSHKARLAAVRASTAVTDGASEHGSSPIDTQPYAARVRPNRPAHTAIPSSPVLAPTMTSGNDAGGSKRGTNPIILLKHSAVAAFEKASSRAPERGGACAAGPHASAATALLAKRSVTDDQEQFVTHTLKHMYAMQRRRSTTAEAYQRFVALVDSFAEPKVVAEEVRSLMNALIQGVAKRDVHSGNVEAEGSDLDEPGQRPGPGKFAIAVLDYRVVEWLRKRKLALKRPQVRSSAGEGRTPGRDGLENEHVVCTIHVDGIIGEGRSRVKAKVVWRGES